MPAIQANTESNNFQMTAELLLDLIAGTCEPHQGESIRLASADCLILGVGVEYLKS